MYVAKYFVIWEQLHLKCVIAAVFPNPVTGGTPTLRVFVSLIKHT